MYNIWTWRDNGIFAIIFIACCALEFRRAAIRSPKAGLYHAGWDLKNSNGEDVAGGVYLFLVELRGPDGRMERVIKKLAVVR